MFYCVYERWMARPAGIRAPFEEASVQAGGSEDSRAHNCPPARFQASGRARLGRDSRGKSIRHARLELVETAAGFAKGQPGCGQRTLKRRGAWPWGCLAGQDRSPAVHAQWVFGVPAPGRGRCLRAELHLSGSDASALKVTDLWAEGLAGGRTNFLGQDRRWRRAVAARDNTVCGPL